MPQPYLKYVTLPTAFQTDADRRDLSLIVIPSHFNVSPYMKSLATLAARECPDRAYIVCDINDDQTTLDISELAGNIRYYHEANATIRNIAEQIELAEKDDQAGGKAKPIALFLNSFQSLHLDTDNLDVTPTREQLIEKVENIAKSASQMVSEHKIDVFLFYIAPEGCSINKDMLIVPPSLATLSTRILGVTGTAYAEPHVEIFKDDARIRMTIEHAVPVDAEPQPNEEITEDIDIVGSVNENCDANVLTEMLGNTVPAQSTSAPTENIAASLISILEVSQDTWNEISNAGEVTAKGTMGANITSSRLASLKDSEYGELASYQIDLDNALYDYSGDQRYENVKTALSNIIAAITDQLPNDASIPEADLSNCDITTAQSANEPIANAPITEIPASFTIQSEEPQQSIDNDAAPQIAPDTCIETDIASETPEIAEFETDLPTEPDSEAEPEPEPEPEPKRIPSWRIATAQPPVTQAEPTSRVEPSPEPELSPEPEAESEPETELVPESKVEPVLQTEIEVGAADSLKTNAEMPVENPNIEALGIEHKSDIETALVSDLEEALVSQPSPSELPIAVEDCIQPIPYVTFPPIISFSEAIDNTNAALDDSELSNQDEINVEHQIEAGAEENTATMNEDSDFDIDLTKNYNTETKVEDDMDAHALVDKLDNTINKQNIEAAIAASAAAIDDALIRKLGEANTEDLRNVSIHVKDQTEGKIREIKDKLEAKEAKKELKKISDDGHPENAVVWITVAVAGLAAIEVLSSLGKSSKKKGKKTKKGKKNKK